MENTIVPFGTIFVSALVILAVFLSFRSIWKDKKDGKGCAGCSCKCGGSCGCSGGCAKDSSL